MYTAHAHLAVLGLMCGASGTGVRGAARSYRALAANTPPPWSSGIFTHRDLQGRQAGEIPWATGRHANPY